MSRNPIVSDLTARLAKRSSVERRCQDPIVGGAQAALGEKILR
jgi:hypothetical protein